MALEIKDSLKEEVVLVLTLEREKHSRHVAWSKGTGGGIQVWGSGDNGRALATRWEPVFRLRLLNSF